MKLTDQCTDPNLARQVTTLVVIFGSIAVNKISNFFRRIGFIYLMIGINKSRESNIFQ